MADRLRSLTLEDVEEVLESSALGDHLTSPDVVALYHWMLDRVIGEEA